MAWDSHLQGYTGITVRDPGEAPRTFRNNEDFLQWQHEQKYEDRTNNSESKAATPSVAHQSKEGLKGKGAAEPAEQANIEEEELHDLFMSAPDEITWPAGNNEVVEGGKVDGEDLRSKVVKASLDGGDNIDDDDDGLHDLFMSEPNEITWYSQANEAVEETPPTGKQKHTSTPFVDPPKPRSRVSRLVPPDSPDFFCPPTSTSNLFLLFSHNISGNYSSLTLPHRYVRSILSLLFFFSPFHHILPTPLLLLKISLLLPFHVALGLLTRQLCFPSRS